MLRLFLQAGLVVQGVMLLLLAASGWGGGVGFGELTTPRRAHREGGACRGWVWAIVFEKFTTLRRANRQASAFEDRFWSGGSLDELYESDGLKPGHPLAAVFGAAMGEWKRSAQVAGADMSRGSVRDRVDRAVGVTVQREMDRLERWMVFLASVGSTAPFIGLFGTVWGIMRSFSAIATSRNTNLSVVAPGIAEALFATAIGLVAAIPAVLAYNKISSDLARFAARLEGFGSEFGAILSRQSEERI